MTLGKEFEIYIHDYIVYSLVVVIRTSNTLYSPHVQRVCSFDHSFVHAAAPSLILACYSCCFVFVFVVAVVVSLLFIGFTS